MTQHVAEGSSPSLLARAERLVDLDARGRRLRAALAAVLVRDHAPEVLLVRAWLDSWSGLVVAGLRRQGESVG